MPAIVFVLLILVIILANTIKILREWERGVVLRLGEFQAAARLAEAAEIMGHHPMSLQLRFLQTLTIIAEENNSTILFPLPIDLLKPLLEGAERTQPLERGARAG